MQYIILAALFAAGYLLYRRSQQQQPPAEQGQNVASSVLQSISYEATQIPVIGSYFVNQETVKKIAIAIGYAEGGYNLDGTNKEDGSRPSRNHNPGDLKGNYAGTAIGTDDAGFDVYTNDVDGWAALYRQVTLWLTNKSHVAGTGDTIRTLASKYTTTEQQAWANNVSSALGISPDTQLGSLA